MTRLNSQHAPGRKGHENNRKWPIFATLLLAFGAAAHCSRLLAGSESGDPILPETKALDTAAWSTDWMSESAETQCAGRPRRLSRENAREDAETWLANVFSLHPEPDSKLFREALQIAVAQVIEGLPEQMDAQFFYARMAPVSALLRDSHTSLKLAIPDSCPRPSLSAQGTQLCLDEPWATFPKGACLKAVGDLLGNEALTLLTGMVAAEIPSERLRRSVELFPVLLSIMESERGSVPLDFELGGRWYQSELSALPRAPLPAQPTVLEIKPLSRIALYVRLRSMAQEYQEYLDDQLLKLFEFLVEHPEIRGLVIDLRQNEGGHTDVGKTLLGYLTTKPYRMFAEKRWRVSGRMQEQLAEFAEPTEEYLLRPRDSILVHTNNERVHARGPGFDGSVVAIIGPETASAAMMTANAIEDFDLATLVGQPTGSPPNYFGEAFVYEMKHSGIVASVSTARFIRANGDAHNPHPVQPDIFVAPDRENGAPSSGEPLEDPEVATAVDALDFLDERRHSLRGLSAMISSP